MNFVQIFLEEGHRHEHGHGAGDKKEADFFHEHSQATGKTGWEDPMTQSSHSSNQSFDKSKFFFDQLR